MSEGKRKAIQNLRKLATSFTFAIQSDGNIYLIRYGHHHVYSIHDDGSYNLISINGKIQ